MVERPIKKSDRAANPPAALAIEPPMESIETIEKPVEPSIEKPVEKSSDRPIKKSDRPAKSLDESGDNRSTKDQRKGKEKYVREESSPTGKSGLALQRGPRPTKPKPPVEEITPEVSAELETLETIES